MQVLEQAKKYIKDGKIQESSINLLEDIANAMSGDTIAIGKIMLTLIRSPWLIREKLFWNKFEGFLSGICLDDSDCKKLCNKLTENGKNPDYTFRLIEIIDRIDTQQKMQYLIKATEHLLKNQIDRTVYFRICHVITHTLDEDLCFLKNNIDGVDFPYNACVQDLLSAGLMYQSVIDGNGNQKFSFTPFATTLNQFSLT